MIRAIFFIVFFLQLSCNYSRLEKTPVIDLQYVIEWPANLNEDEIDFSICDATDYSYFTLKADYKESLVVIIDGVEYKIEPIHDRTPDAYPSSFIPISNQKEYFDIEIKSENSKESLLEFKLKNQFKFTSLYFGSIDNYVIYQSDFFTYWLGTSIKAADIKSIKIDKPENYNELLKNSNKKYEKISDTDVYKQDNIIFYSDKNEFGDKKIYEKKENKRNMKRVIFINNRKEL